MAWFWPQSTGFLTAQDGSLAGVGYSGFGVGKNNGAMQDVHGVGPIPVGNYSIGPPEEHPHLGNAMPLTPMDGTETFGRSGFYVHGKNLAHPDDSSHGCPVIDKHPRDLIWESGDHVLTVVP